MLIWSRVVHSFIQREHVYTHTPIEKARNAKKKILKYNMCGLPPTFCPKTLQQAPCISHTGMTGNEGNLRVQKGSKTSLFQRPAPSTTPWMSWRRGINGHVHYCILQQSNSRNFLLLFVFLRNLLFKSETQNIWAQREWGRGKDNHVDINTIQQGLWELGLNQTVTWQIQDTGKWGPAASPKNSDWW